ncbi:MAG: cobyric acid synthase [Oligoflexales bacterium]|nr:cobyric acid synthase [Oligoflexales bacterium]
MAKSIMIQGTMSSAGKSLITAGLCRIFRQDGIRVAPFKSQNMALNSYITSEGLEMGRAQVVQAEAAGIEPSVRMNPILLKPTSDRGSQVILNGEVIGNMTAAEYFAAKRKLIPDIMQAYRSLENEYDLIVIEGAGSPVEINLKDDDIVNMGMARMAGAPVLLIADIDRGGVFASIYGTVMLLDDEERGHLKGTVINKFRGDIEVLRPGLGMIEEKASLKVLGVVPYLKIDIEDEDSLSDRMKRERAFGKVDIAVIRTPRISNFTDFNVFELIPYVTLRYVETLGQLGTPDMIILPGSKNTMGDLIWLRQCGLEEAIRKKAREGVALFGICGGYQMLGMRLEDPYGTEYGGAMEGMGLLPIKTVFAREKVRRQVKGRFSMNPGHFSRLAGMSFSGYEIHMGISDGNSRRPLTEILDAGVDQSEREDGCVDGNVMGTYVHGIFDEDGVAEAVASSLMEGKGLAAVNPPAGASYRKHKESQFDILASALRESIDINAVYDIIERGL